MCIRDSLEIRSHGGSHRVVVGGEEGVHGTNQGRSRLLHVGGAGYSCLLYTSHHAETVAVREVRTDGFCFSKLRMNIQAKQHMKTKKLSQLDTAPNR